MEYIKGKIRNIIYQNNDNGYVVALFRIKETNDSTMKDHLNKTVTITGVFLDINTEDIYILKGEYLNHERFGYQYKVNSYEREEPTTESGVIEFLASPLVKGCGEKTAIKIVETLGVDAVKLIKENKVNLLMVPGMSEAKAEKIYNSIIAHQSADDILIKLKNLGFTTTESTKIYNKHKENVNAILDTNLYLLVDIIDFNKLDKVYTTFYCENSDIRTKACIIEGMKRLSNANGDTYSLEEEIYSAVTAYFNLIIDHDEFSNMLYELTNEGKIVNEDKKYYLKDYYEMEISVAKHLLKISEYTPKVINDFDEKIEELESVVNVNYNSDQQNAIRTALENSITIISGGPGTGKTTIINAIVKLYIKQHKMNPLEVFQNIALLAPTGRASKKMAMSTGLPAMTIHRYLKWNKDTNDFGVGEYNKNQHKLIIVDEVSMIDISLFSALLKGINSNIQLILVGDSFQLPSVGAGLVLNDLIESDLFNFCPLEQIYRQSSNSYIPYLARDIKEKNISEEFMEKRDDYNFLMTENTKVKDMIKKICMVSIEKGLRDTDIQVLAPMYKGENGIDNLNVILRDLFNPKSDEKKEITIGDVMYRVNDKVLQLANNPDCNVYNGDIGYIKKIETKLIPRKKDIITIDFDGNYVDYGKDDMFMIKHAYAITIHKSQGSEFAHVIMPVCRNYYKMLYNKLIYTGVSRAKKSLVIIGEANALLMAINNDYSSNRKTTLKEKLMHIFLD